MPRHLLILEIKASQFPQCFAIASFSIRKPADKRCLLLVEILDYKSEREKWQGDFNIYRIVEVLWLIDWQSLPSSAKADEVFGYSVKAYQGGDVMFLETMPTFQQHWPDQGGLPDFQERVRSMLNLPESSDNG